MGYPSLEQYQEALQHPRTALLDPELSAGSIATSGLGLPMVLCGGFALTYTVSTKSAKYAVRCFHREAPDLESRYRAISTRLKQLSSDYFLPFEFQSRGVRIAGKEYPIVKMAWASGETLGDFVANNYRSTKALESLRRSLASMATLFESQQIAHGDIQPGNLIVSKGGGTIQLIDYDGMFIPSIQSLGPSEIGHRNFQHPKRAKQFDCKLDRFSLICLDVALQALVSNSKLWDETQSDSETFLFRANDFADVGSSTIFQKLASSSGAKAFAAICSNEMEQTPTLADFALGRNIPQLRIAAKPRVVEVARYISQYLVLNATDYDAFVRNVGSMVELVGQITNIKRGHSRRGGYLFINFGDWRGNIVKLTAWSAALPKVEKQITDALIGCWVSVVGLVEPPYVSHRYKYSHISIDITGAGQVRVISSDEAKYRLGGEGGFSGSNANRDILGRLRGSSTGGRASKAAGVNSNAPAGSRNASILDQMRQHQGTTPSASGSSKSGLPPVVPTPRGQPSSKLNGVPWWVWVGGLLLCWWLFTK